MFEQRKKVTFSLNPAIARALQKAALADGRNTSRYLEAILAHFLGMEQPEPIPAPKAPTDRKKATKSQ